MGVGLTNPVHVALVLVALILVFGAKRLPDLGRSLGMGIREFKDSVNGTAEPALPASGAAADPAAPAVADAASFAPVVATRSERS